MAGSSAGKQAGFEPVVKNATEVVDYFKDDVECWGTMVKAIGFSN
jgi:hypothetical protein